MFKVWWRNYKSAEGIGFNFLFNQIILDAEGYNHFPAIRTEEI